MKESIGMSWFNEILMWADWTLNFLFHYYLWNPCPSSKPTIFPKSIRHTCSNEYNNFFDTLWLEWHNFFCLVQLSRIVFMMAILLTLLGFRTSKIRIYLSCKKKIVLIRDWYHWNPWKSLCSSEIRLKNKFVRQASPCLMISMG